MKSEKEQNNDFEVPPPALESPSVSSLGYAVIGAIVGFFVVYNVVGFFMGATGEGFVLLYLAALLLGTPIGAIIGVMLAPSQK